uniref:Uncharacterized protein n=1 Tax=Salix viminalis TaxID=40686 RepID=A0A6N2N0N5_SALVM
MLLQKLLMAGQMVLMFMLLRHHFLWGNHLHKMEYKLLLRGLQVLQDLEKVLQSVRDQMKNIVMIFLERHLLEFVN